MLPARNISANTPPDLKLPLGLLSSYLFFLTRRPISTSNRHYLEQRLRGFRSLIPLFENSDAEHLRLLVKGLRCLQPANFARAAREMQFQLLGPVSEAAIPPDFILSSNKPPVSPFTGARKVVIVTGPAIGIGDEIILFPLPSWIKATCPQAQITVISGYEGLWARVNGVDELLHYRTHRELLDILRSEADVILLADFEKPGLVPLVACEPGASTYVELSLGAQSTAVVSRVARRIWTINTPPEVILNYYEAFHSLVEGLGIAPAVPEHYSGIVQTVEKASTGPLRIFVSPFTSKNDPSPLYWGRVLACLFSRAPYRPVEFVLDPGPSPSTERLSSAIVASAAARAVHGVSFSVAGGAASRRLSLAGVFVELEQADVVICADSFAAHAAPRFDCVTLVLARSGLRNWRTPWPQSFYFNPEQNIDEMLAAMREVLEARYAGLLGLSQKVPWLQRTVALHLSRATAELKSAMLEVGGKHWNSATVVAARLQFLATHRALLDTITDWPSGIRALVDEDDLVCRWRELDEQTTDLNENELRRHLQLEIRNWERTNLCRFIRLLSMGESNERSPS